MNSFDQAAFSWIHQFAGRHVLLDDLGIFFATYVPYFLVAAFLLLAWQAGEWRKRAYLFAEGALAVMVGRGLIVEIIRWFYHEPRPFDVYGFVPLVQEGGWSFPSAHAAWFFALALIVWYADRTWGAWLFIFAIGNGLARVYAGVHWPTDIIGGAVIGMAVAWAVHRLLGQERKALFGTTARTPTPGSGASPPSSSSGSSPSSSLNSSS